MRVGTGMWLSIVLATACGRVGYDGVSADPADASAVDAPPAPVPTACGNGTVERAELCDDGNRTGGDGCAADCLARELCGDGALAGAEHCDDGNGTGGDGCETDCTFTCTADADCDDGAPCNGDETCDATHVCAAGEPLPDATECGAGLACRGGACAPLTCGNGAIDAGEACDDANTTGGDGCENDCTFTCTADEDCADESACNGTETCDTAAHVCAGGMTLANGAECDRDAMPATRDLCLGGDCVRSTCGDGHVDAAAGESCDDGNSVNGDGCDNDCAPSCVEDADCDNADPCDGIESCDPSAGRCVAGTPAVDGTACPSGTCMGGVCQASAPDAGPTGGGGGGGRPCGGCARDDRCCHQSPGCELCWPSVSPCPKIICEPM